MYVKVTIVYTGYLYVDVAVTIIGIVYEFRYHYWRRLLIWLPLCTGYHNVGVKRDLEEILWLRVTVMCGKITIM